MPRTLLLIIACLTVFPAWALDWVGNELDGSPCKGGGQGFGPYDYFDVNDQSDPLFQEGRWWEAIRVHYEPGLYHMSQNPMSLVNYQRAAAEFDYLLRAYPNHPEVLRSVAELEFKKQRQNKQSRVPLFSDLPPPECYFQRAISFRPDNAYLYGFYATYLHKLKRYDMALQNYQRAIQLDENNAEAHYNAGLCYLDVGDLDKAAYHADRAYELGYPLPGLRRKLERMSRQ